MVDPYTKAMLTLIAMALCVIAGQDFIPTARAQVSGPVHVIVDSVAQFAFQYTTVPVSVQP